MITRILVRLVIEGIEEKEGVEGLQELCNDMHEALFNNIEIEHFLIFVL
jgi:hypothetical protein